MDVFLVCDQSTSMFSPSLPSPREAVLPFPVNVAFCLYLSAYHLLVCFISWVIVTNYADCTKCVEMIVIDPNNKYER